MTGIEKELDLFSGAIIITFFIMQSAEHKKLYEQALSSPVSAATLEQTLSSILKQAVINPVHYDFLLHHINWTQEPYVQHLGVLAKVLRLSRGRGRQAERVGYNLLAEGMATQEWGKFAKVVVEVTGSGCDSQLLKECLVENYPYKGVQLETQLNYLRAMLHLQRNLHFMNSDILEVIVVQLASFDTELCAGDRYSYELFPSDQTIKADRFNYINDADHCKFDRLLAALLEQISNNNKGQGIFNQLLVIFKSHLIFIQQTKYTQFILYCLAEQTKQRAKTFLAFLYGEIMEAFQLKTNKKVFTVLNDYLSSYVGRSLAITSGMANKILKNIINLIKSVVEQRKTSPTNRTLTTQQSPYNLSDIFEQHHSTLLLLQTAMRIWSTRPDSHQQSCLKQLARLCQQLKPILHFEYFISHDLLKQIKNITVDPGKMTNQLPQQVLKIGQKFNPPLLKILALHVDPMLRRWQAMDLGIKLEQVKTEVKEESAVCGIPMKRVKSQKKASDGSTCYSVRNE